MGPAVRWIPAVILASAAACSGAIVGTKFIKTQTINAAAGGTIIVSQRDDANLAGLTIVIPPRALASTTTITVAEAAALGASQLGGATQDGTTAELAAGGASFRIPVTVSMPFAAAGGSDLSAIAVEDDGTFFNLADAGLSIDAGGVAFPVNAFAKSYAVVHQPPTGVECGVGFIACDAGVGSICVDPLADSQNCKGCGEACPTGESCVGGDCECLLTTCQGDAGPVCSDTESDPRNCRACGNACRPGEDCISHTCECILSSTYGLCATDGGPACVDLQTDSVNCGHCGNQCADNQRCTEGVCTCDEPDAGPQLIENCNGTCVDTTVDPLNCGSCGNVCVSGGCNLGDAGIGICPCPPPYTQCVPSCVDTFGDINHCGGCDISCVILGPGIVDLSCNLGHCFCGTDAGVGTICPNGTCAALESDANNCGFCGNVCTAPAIDCVNATCACPGAETLCGVPDSGFPLYCADTALDPGNCGVCGNVCDETYAIGSVCAVGLCACAPPTSFLCGVAGSGQCLRSATSCDAGSNPSPDGG